MSTAARMEPGLEDGHVDLPSRQLAQGGQLRRPYTGRGRPQHVRECLRGRVAALFYGRGVSVDGNDVEPDLAMELELRDELLVACRQLLLGIGTREAAALVAHIDPLLDLDDEASPRLAALTYLLGVLI